MPQTFRTACVQNCAGPDMAANIAEAERLAIQAATDGADLICLPEFFSCLDVGPERFEVGATDEENHPALPVFTRLARDYHAWILLGSLAVKTASGKIRNRSILIDSGGEIVSRYDKIHLFDVDLTGGENYRESLTVEAGEKAVLAPTPWGLMGLTVCYDLRFAHLYRTMAQAGAMFFTVPAAFTMTTGKAHWHPLLRARAIETGSFVFAPCQWGRHGKAETYGHSLIIDPWGVVLADGGEADGIILVEIDPDRVATARAMIPALLHDRPYAGPEPATIERTG
ncbi:MAG: carbon-nitrogen hydrolase family protein [Rhodospirillales bacterium]